MWVQIPPWVQMKRKPLFISDRCLLAYIIGVALGDGNLSNPNGRATRLRITCDLKYPLLIQKIRNSIAGLLPSNKVSLVKSNGNYLNISCYSNYWESLLGWYVGKGSKLIQNISIPNWIKKKDEYKIHCLRGLIETDGSIYSDRGYKAVMFTSAIPNLAKDVYKTITCFGFHPRFYTVSNGRNPVYRIRVATNVQQFLDLVKPEKI